jgi:hypothetical protein
MDECVECADWAGEGGGAGLWEEREKRRNLSLWETCVGVGWEDGLNFCLADGKLNV